MTFAPEHVTHRNTRDAMHELTLAQWLREIEADSTFHYEIAERRRPAPWLLFTIANPSLRATALMRLSAGSKGLAHYFWRNLLLTLHGCDVAAGAHFAGPVDLPHPIGIVIGQGVQVGPRARIFQHVTLGRSRNSGYPVVGSDAILYAGCVVAGALTLGARVTVGANAVVGSDVPDDAVVRVR